MHDLDHFLLNWRREKIYIPENNRENDKPHLNRSNTFSPSLWPSNQLQNLVLGLPCCCCCRRCPWYETYRCVGEMKRLDFCY